ASTSAGYPRFTDTPGVETGRRNLAIFTAGCNFRCGFCQDWIHDTMLSTGGPRFTRDEIADWIDEATTCVSFCGGNPDMQLNSVVDLAGHIRTRFAGRTMRLCVETNLTAPWPVLERLAEIVLASGGGFNVGLKAGSEAVHRALTGASNGAVWRNLGLLHARFGMGDEVALLRPSLLCVPGYVDETEVRLVARRLLGIDPGFSLVLLPWYPRFLTTDQPGTRTSELVDLARAARDEGLRRVSPDPDQPPTGDRFVRA
ncbi:MAG: radical SAM protein, partial [Alphaproteobacteria bacterium]|nr:radical SAM protein [Alphaproteobacteria bacterium]